MIKTRKVVHEYYDGWITGRLDQSRNLMADDCIFKSPQDKFLSADAFLTACSHLSDGLTGVKYVKEIYSDSEAFVILEWQIDQDQSFMDAEYLRIKSGKITEIIVVNNSADFGKMVR